MRSEGLAERALRAVLARRAGKAPAPEVEAPPPLARPSGEAPSAFNSSSFDMVPVAAPVEDFVPSRVVHLVRWPEMRRVPLEKLGHCAHICALLAHSPSVGFLVHRRLGLPRDEVMPLLYGLHADGYLRMAGAGPQDQALAEPAQEAEEAPSAAAPAAPAAGGIFSRWLGRLLG
jgi:hypothetical protein